MVAAAAEPQDAYKQQIGCEKCDCRAWLTDDTKDGRDGWAERPGTLQFKAGERHGDTVG